MLEFIASAGVWSLGILGFGLGAFVCLLRSLGGRDALRALGLHLTGVSLLIGFGGTAVGLFKHHHVVGEGPQSSRSLASLASSGSPSRPRASRPLSRRSTCCSTASGPGERVARRTPESSGPSTFSPPSAARDPKLKGAPR